MLRGSIDFFFPVLCSCFLLCVLQSEREGFSKVLHILSRHYIQQICTGHFVSMAGSWARSETSAQSWPLFWFCLH